MAYLSTVASSAFDFQNFFSAKLTSSLTASDTDIPMDTIPSISEGVLVIDWDVAASREVIFFNSKTATKVVCPSAANGRGFDGSTATTHASGANVIMAPVADYFRYIQYIATTSTAAWKPLGYTPNTITDGGDRIYTMVFNSVDLTSFISIGMKLKGTPTTAQPTKCATLNGTTQYFSRASGSVSGITFTNNFTCGAWIKKASYGDQAIISRYNGTSGWIFRDRGGGDIQVFCANGGAANSFTVTANSSVRLNRWVHVAAQVDMSVTTNTPTTNYIMYDGKDVAATCARGGTNPVTLAQAGDLNVGAYNVGLFPHNGKFAQVFVASAKITQANMQLIKNQGLTAAYCTTYSIASAYSFNNSITDINTGNANDLTAQGGAVATTADSPFGLDDVGTPGTNEWGVVINKSFSTNTTLTVQAPEGSAWPTLPTSSMISSMSYSTEKAPYGFPLKNPEKLMVLNQVGQSGIGATLTQVNGLTITIPAVIGKTYRVTALGRSGISAGGAGYVLWAICVGSVAAANAIVASQPMATAAGVTVPFFATTEYTAPSTGNLTFCVGFNITSNTVSLESSTTAPAYLMVEPVEP